MKLILAAAALASLLSGASCVFAQDRSSNQSNATSYDRQNDQAVASSYAPANPDNLPRVPGASHQPGDPDAVTDNYTATHQPALGTAGPVPAVAVPRPSRDNAQQ
jgi:hypothetical protein